MLLDRKHLIAMQATEKSPPVRRPTADAGSRQMSSILQMFATDSCVFLHQSDRIRSCRRGRSMLFTFRDDLDIWVALVAADEVFENEPAPLAC